MEISKIYDRRAEKVAVEQGVDMVAFERLCRPYVDFIVERGEALRSGDAEYAWRVLSDSNKDRQKHAAHNAAVEATRQLAKLGVYTGDLNNRQEVGAFACAFVGESAYAQYVD